MKAAELAACAPLLTAREGQQHKYGESKRVLQSARGSGKARAMHPGSLRRGALSLR